MSKQFSFRVMMGTFVSICVFSALLAAEYQGRNIDGELYDARVKNRTRSSVWYRVKVEFDADKIIIYFREGGRVRLTLSDEEIDDPSDIEAKDRDRGNYWMINVEGLEE